MLDFPNRWYRRVRLWIGALALFGLASSCDGSGNVSPSAETPQAGDSLANPADAPPIPNDSLLIDTTGAVPQGSIAATGIPFGAMNMRAKYMNSMYNGTQRGIDPPYLMAELQLARSKGVRIVLKMAGKQDDLIQNADGTFSLDKWKNQVNRYKGLNIGPYITDGTIIGHFLIDEPEHASKWGGKPIPQATVEAMARYSKQLWPGMTTFARSPPSYLARLTTTYVYLDAGWLQEATNHPNVTQWVSAESEAARLKGLGLMVGLNVLNGGKGSSGVPGTRQGHWAMSASEIRTFGSAVISAPRACGFLVWTYLYFGADYLARPDIKSAMTDLWNKAKAHPKVSCRQ